MQLEGVGGDDFAQTRRGNCRREREIGLSDAASRRKLTWGRVHKKESFRRAHLRAPNLADWKFFGVETRRAAGDAATGGMINSTRTSSTRAAVYLLSLTRYLGEQSLSKRFRVNLRFFLLKKLRGRNYLIGTHSNCGI